jgi:hypothetical protein
LLVADYTPGELAAYTLASCSQEVSIIRRLLLYFLLWITDIALKVAMVALFFCFVEDDIRNRFDHHGQMLLLGGLGLCLLLLAVIHGVRQVSGLR